MEGATLSVALSGGAAIQSQSCTGRKRSDPVSIAEYPAERPVADVNDTLANTRHDAASSVHDVYCPCPNAMEAETVIRLGHGRKRDQGSDGHGCGNRKGRTLGHWRILEIFLQ
jgi:hypothetical protein